MPTSRPVRHTLGTLCGAACVVVLCLIYLTALLHLREADLSMPLAYHADAFLYGTWVKGLVEHGWYLHNPSVGAPAGLDLHDFPLSDGLHFLLLKGLALLTGDFALTFNLFFLLTFPLTALTALGVLRHFGISWGPAAVASLLFTFLPYHLFRGPLHLFLASYFMIPPLVMIALWLYLDQLPVCARDPDDANGYRRRPSGRFLLSLVICLLGASTGIYYAFFAGFFLLVAGSAAGLSRRRWAPVGLAGTLAGVLVLGILLNVAPNLWYRWQHGYNPEAVMRNLRQVEEHGLKIAQLLLPVQYHRLPALAQLQLTYRVSCPLVNENDWATLGGVGAVGFLVLVGRLLSLRRANPAGPRLADGLCLLNVLAVLLATIGGFGAWLAFVISPWIRAYNRISVYIAFFALFMVALLLDKAGRYLARSGSTRLLYLGLLGLLLGAGLWDQASLYILAQYNQPREEYAHDAAFVQALEASLPPGALVFQLPYVPYPENGWQHRMADYDHFRAYFHSRTLRWSYGAMKGRPGDICLKQLAGLPVEDLVENLAIAGFAGIYLDRFGYVDAGAAVESGLERVLGAQPLVSGNNRLVFFNLTEYGRRLRSRIPEAQWEQRREALLHSAYYLWGRGFHYPETDGTNHWKWCSAAGELLLFNPADRPVPVTLSLTLWTTYSTPARVWLEGPGLDAVFPLSSAGTAVQETLTIPPGHHVLRLRSDGQRVVANDPRDMVFMVRNLKFTTHPPGWPGPAAADQARADGRGGRFPKPGSRTDGHAVLRKEVAGT